MATLQNFDSEIAKTKQVVEEMRSKIEQSGIVLDKFAKADQKIGAADFDIENARIQDVINQQKVMEGNIADLIIGLEDATNVFGTEFESMKSYTGWEKFVGIFSEAAQAAHAHRARAQHVARRQSAGAAGQVRHDRRHPEGPEAGARARYKTSEASLAQVIERRKATIDEPRGDAEAHRGAEPAAARHREPDRRLDRPEGAHASSKASARSSPPNTTRSRPRSRNCWPRARRWNATPRCSRPSSTRSTTRSPPRTR